MPCDMTMEWPHPRIIGIEFQHEKARLVSHSGLYQLGVSPLRVDRIGCAIELACAFGYDPEIVAVKMHRVGDKVHVVVQHNADRAVFTEIVDIPLWVGRVGCVPLVGE